MFHSFQRCFKKVFLGSTGNDIYKCRILPKFYLTFVILLSGSSLQSQIDSLAKNLMDTLVSKLIVDDIPHKTFGERFMYPHRWYVKQLLAPKVSDFDTNYIRAIKHRLVVTVPLAKKYYGFNINDIHTKKEVKFSPNNYYHVGFNFNNVIVSFGFYPGIRFGEKANAGHSSSKDIQVTFIGRRVITDINFQKYKGLYVLNSKDFQAKGLDIYEVYVRPDIKVFSFGVNSMFVFNYRKYSMRGSFSYTDIQKRSAGSFLLGIYHSVVTFSSADSTLVSMNIRNNFSKELYDINAVSLITIGLSGGYGYNVVYKRIIASSVLNLGIGIQKTNYTTQDDQGHTLGYSPSAHLNAKAAIRYDKIRYFFGMMAVYDTNYTLNPEMYNIESYTSKVLLFFGYRFNVRKNGRKVLKAMGLVDFK